MLGGAAEVEVMVEGEAAGRDEEAVVGLARVDVLEEEIHDTQYVCTNCQREGKRWKKRCGERCTRER